MLASPLGAGGVYDARVEKCLKEEAVGIIAKGNRCVRKSRVDSGLVKEIFRLLPLPSVS